MRRNRLLIRRKIHKLLDLRLLPFIGPTDGLVAAEAGPDWRHAGIDRPLCREVAVLAVDSVYAGVNGMRERDRLDRIGLTVGRHGSIVLRLYERRQSQERESDDGCTDPSLRHMQCRADGGGRV